MAERGMPWIRVDVDFEDHPKFGDLSDRLRDPLAALYVVRLWRFAGKHFPDGSLITSMRRIEEGLRWRKKSGDLVAALLDCRFIDEVDGGYSVHGWEEHNGGAFAKMKYDRRIAQEKRERSKQT